jgi:hypothetical protein
MNAAAPETQLSEDIATFIVNAAPAPAPEALRAAMIHKLEADAREYNRLHTIEEEVKAGKAVLKPGIMLALKTYGAVPDGAPKTRRIETEGFVCDLTVGTTTEIDDVEVAFLDEMLSRSRRLRHLFSLMFRRRYEYTLEPTAQQTILYTKWPKEIREQVRNAYMRCISARTTAPSLSIESKAEIAARQREAQEAAEAKALAAAAKKAKTGKAA